MKIRYMIMMANHHLSDAEMIREGMRVAELAEGVGYDRSGVPNTISKPIPLRWTTSRC